MSSFKYLQKMKFGIWLYVNQNVKRFFMPEHLRLSTYNFFIGSCLEGLYEYRIPYYWLVLNVDEASRTSLIVIKVL